MEACNGYGEIEESQGDTLFDYVMKNDLKQAQAHLLNPETDVNALNCTSKSSLYLAIEYKNIDMVKLLINNGADINLSSYSHTFGRFEIPLVTAVRLENEELINLLLGLGCAMEGKGGPGREEKTALQWASTYGDISLADKLLQHGADINHIGPSLHTALHYATLGDKVDMVKWLLKKGAKMGTNADKRSPLHVSAVRGNLSIVKHLFNHGCDVDLEDKFHFSAFSLACLRGHLSVVIYMLENSPAGIKHDLIDGLHRAADGGHLNIMKLLLNHGASVNGLNKLGESPLSTAARAGQANAVALMLEHGSRLDIIDKRGYTPLQLSLLREPINVSISLIQHGSPLHSLRKGIESPLNLAMTTSNPLLVKSLLQAGCRLSREPWFTDKSLMAKLQEVEYMTPGPLRFRRETDHQKETWKWLMSQIRQPCPLRQIVRVAIREWLSEVTGGCSIMSRIAGLPLPPTLLAFVQLDDVLLE